MRAFRFTGLVAIDEDEAFDEEQRAVNRGPVTMEELKNYLATAARVNWLVEDFGNAVGVASIELHYDDMKELPEAEVKELYGPDK